MKTLRRPLLTAVIAVMSALGALVHLLPAPHESAIDPAQIVPVDTQQTWFPQR